MTIRNLTNPPAKKYSLVNTSVVSNGGFTAFYQSRNRTTFYAVSVGGSGQNNLLSRSTDGGTTWTTVRNFSGYQGLSSSIRLVQMVELDDGEVLLGFSTSGAGPTQIWKSTGWASNPVTATWSAKTTLSGGNPIQYYSLNNCSVGSNGIVLASEGGSQTGVTITTGIVVVNKGVNYTTMTLTADAASGGTPGTATVTLSNGSIQKVTVTSVGSGQTTGTYNWKVTGDGNYAVVTYRISGGVIATVQYVIIDPGTGYTTMNLSAAGSGGTGEVVTARLVGGSITGIGVLAAGSGHTPGTYNFAITGDGVGAVVQYTTTGVMPATQSNRATRLRLSTDFGNTWTTILDLYTSLTYKYPVGVHIHAVAYDQDWDRIWVTMGDDANGQLLCGGVNKTQVLYSDDRGLSWQALDAEPYHTKDGILAQYTAIRIFDNCIIATEDAMPNGFFSTIWPRIRYRKLGTPVFGPSMTLGNVGLGFEPLSAYSTDDSQPVFITYSGGNGTVYEPTFFVTPDNGKTYYEIWRETDLATRPLLSGATIRIPLGPDTSGRFLANYNNYNSFLKGTIVTNF